MGNSIRSWVLLLILCFSSGAHAATVSELQRLLKPGHPERYTVREGDTLWDISNTFLAEAWHWPELWVNNPHIENPHLIYPGDTIVLVYVDGRPTLQLERGQAGRTLKLTPQGGDTERLTPRIRATPLTSAIPVIRLDTIRSFLSRSRIVEPDEMDNAPHVVQGAGKRLVMGAGDRVYARGEWLQEAPVYGVFRHGEVYVDPYTEEVLGFEAHDVGLGRVVRAQGEIRTLALTTVREEVRIGDRLLPTEREVVATSFVPRAPADGTEGEIISVVGGVTQVGQYDVVVINRGIREGIEPGHVMAIYQYGGVIQDPIKRDYVELPDERAGLLMVFRSYEKLSYCLVLETERPLAIADQVRAP